MTLFQGLMVFGSGPVFSNIAPFPEYLLVNILTGVGHLAILK